ncbi:MAG: hypothetical protein AABX37_03905 [Nanoarchaeota archaeon]
MITEEKAEHQEEKAEHQEHSVNGGDGKEGEKVQPSPSFEM